ncbi:hypothetical protein BD560DRAFT_414720 [Blakeslea trispora]|nr:hypothetical protein BD560DRAFT_414720 [Blakeslea trispora]
MKRSIDHQAVLGIQSPKCFGLLVDGLVVTSFAAQLNNCGIYSVLELEEFSLLDGKSDLGILSDIVLSFCWLKVRVKVRVYTYVCEYLYFLTHKFDRTWWMKLQSQWPKEEEPPLALRGC